MTNRAEEAAPIESERELQAHYPEPMEVVSRKVIDHIDAHCRRFIELSPFCCLGTTDASGRGDVSPRGDEPASSASWTSGFCCSLTAPATIASTRCATCSRTRPSG